MAKKFIATAIRHPGRLTAAAKKAGMSVPAFAAREAHKPTSLGAAARFYTNVLAPINRSTRKSK